jgi:hypothetical protein
MPTQKNRKYTKVGRHWIFLYISSLLNRTPEKKIKGQIVKILDCDIIGFGDVDWIHLAQDRDRWQALVNMVMNLQVP